MDAAAILLTWVLTNPAAQVGTSQTLAGPGQVDQGALDAALAEFGAEALKCYHRSAHFQAIDVVSGNWEQRGKFGADGSVGMRIRYAGVTKRPYHMDLVLLVKPGHVRTVVLADTALLRRNAKCRFESWVAVRND